MTFSVSPCLLRQVLFADAALSLATGAVQILPAAPLADLLRLPAPFLVGSGWIMLGYGAVVGWAATRDPLRIGLVMSFALGNFAWALACVALLAGGWIAPNAFGAAWILVQAVAVAVLGELQWAAARGVRIARAA